MQPEDLMLLTDFYEYTMAYAYFKENKHEEIAYFDMFVRTIPDGGGFLILNGLHRFIDFITPTIKLISYGRPATLTRISCII